MTLLAYSIFHHACKVQQNYFWLPVVIFIIDLRTSLLPHDSSDKPHVLTVRAGKVVIENVSINTLKCLEDSNVMFRTHPSHLPFSFCL